MKPKYSIVRVDGKHKPSHFEVERIENIADLKLLDNVVETYGDTKEQLIMKVAQVLLKQDLNCEVFNPSKKMVNAFYKGCLRRAKEIVEFLGVEE